MTGKILFAYLGSCMCLGQSWWVGCKRFWEVIALLGKLPADQVQRRVAGARFGVEHVVRLPKRLDYFTGLVC